MAEFKYDHVVVGAGISGLTAALLLSRQGGRVLILEKAPDIGGSMARFSLDGVPFDTGFHFTGGLSPDGLVYDMLKVLGIEQQIHPVSFSPVDGTRFIFEGSGNAYCFPIDREGSLRVLREKFPDEAGAIETYFQKLDSVCSETTSMNLRTIGESMHLSDEDYVCLADVLDGLFEDPELKAMLAGYCLCYGASPSEISFANHARMVQGMHAGVVRAEGGGDAFVSAIKAELITAGVDIRCRSHVISCEELDERNVGAFRLNNGDLIRFNSAVLTIHPLSMLEMLPKEKLRPAFVKRIEGFQPSFGFFAVFGVCDAPDLLEDFILLGLPDTNLDTLFKPGRRDMDSMLFCITGKEEGTRTLTILEAVCPEDMAEWKDSSLMKRPAAYTEYKVRKTDRIMERIYSHLPKLKGHFQVLDSSSPLTFRDYLYSPDGSAYGVKQKMGQFNVLGRLPLRNLYAAGQSSVLPGVMGAMVSSFIVCRQMLDEVEFDCHVNAQLNRFDDKII